MLTDLFLCVPRRERAWRQAERGGFLAGLSASSVHLFKSAACKTRMTWASAGRLLFLFLLCAGPSPFTGARKQSTATTMQ